MNKPASQESLEHAPRPGHRYRHYKGGLYEVVTSSVKEDTLEILVTYRSLEKGSIWTRTLENWREKVDTPDGQVSRFRFLDPLDPPEDPFDIGHI